jgi:hypothetical protein
VAQPYGKPHGEQQLIRTTVLGKRARRESITARRSPEPASKATTELASFRSVRRSKNEPYRRRVEEKAERLQVISLETGMRFPMQ